MTKPDDLVDRLRVLASSETHTNPFGVEITSHPTMGDIEWQEACAEFIADYGKHIADRIEALEEALRKIANISYANYGRQNEKLSDIEPIARSALTAMQGERSSA